MTGLDTDPSSSRRRLRGGLRFRIAATAAVVALAGLSAVRLASAAFDDTAVPIGQIASIDGAPLDSMVSGTVHLTRGQLIIYNGDRVGSYESRLAINFSNGGALILCPHSQLQILAAKERDGRMLAFGEGGSQQPFQIHPNDVVMTPDWRIQLAGDLPSDAAGTLQVSTNRRGELCLSSNAKAGQSFRVSQLTGDSVYDVTGQSSIRIAGGRINNAPGGCSCEAIPADAGASPAPAPPTPSALAVNSSPVTAPAAQPAAAPPVPRPPTPAPAVPASAPASTPVTQPVAAAVAISPAPRRPKQRPEDVAGYVRSFFHLLFGR